MDTMGTALWDLYENQKAKGLSAAMRQTLYKLEKSGQADDRWFNAMGELAVQEKAFAIAARFFRSAMDEKAKPEYELNLGNALFYAGDYPAARKILLTYLDRYPGDVHAMIDLANCHLQLGELGKARELCQSGLTQKAAKAPLYNCLGQIAWLEGDPQRAYGLFDRAYTEAPEYTDALFNRANMACRLDRVEAALEDFAMCVRKDENFEAALMNMAVLRLERGELAEGKRDIEKALRLNPANVEARHLLGRLCLAAKEFRAARDAFRDAIKRDADHIPTQLALAKLHIQESEPAEAGLVLRQLLAKPGLGAEETVACLSLLMEMGETTQCIQHLQRMPDASLSSEARKLMVLGLWKLGRSKDAISQLESLLEKEGETPATLTMLGRMLVQSGAEDLAEARYRKALELDPGSQGAGFELARILLDRENGLGAAQVLTGILREQPDDPDCLYNMACCHARNGNFDDSLHYLKRAVECGFRDLDKINGDGDLEAIRQFKEYSQLAGQTDSI
jgi:tetratricopeptide (TPR) repeat protein